MSSLLRPLSETNRRGLAAAPGRDDAPAPHAPSTAAHSLSGGNSRVRTVHCSAMIIHHARRKCKHSAQIIWCCMKYRVGRAHMARQCASGRKSGLGARLRTREVTGRDASLPAPLLTVPLELVGRGTVGALPQTPPEALPLDSARGRRKGTKPPLDPFARLSWLLFPVPLACGFLVLRLNYYFPHSGRGYSPSSALRSIALATTALSSWYVTPYQRSGQVSTRAVAR